VLSYESELGKRLIGRRPGDELEVAGERLRVLGIEPAAGAAAQDEPSPK
jgi:transcription elongation GreA/GreB family factor